MDVHHYSYSLGALIGSKPHLLYLMCTDCHKQIEFDQKNNKLSLIDVQKKTLKSVMPSFERKQGKSNPRIGYWFKNQIKMNEPVKQKILEKIKCLTTQ